MPPGPISNLQVIASTANTLNLTWEMSGYIDQIEFELSYTIKMCLKTGGPLNITISDGSMRSHTLGDLNEDSNYTIIVRAVNTEGSTVAMTKAATLMSGQKCDAILAFNSITIIMQLPVVFLGPSASATST